MPHVTLIHGIANKPPAEQLLDLWLRGLADATGLDLGAEGVTSSMVYWADVMYAEPVAEGAAEESASDETLVETEASETADLGLEGMDASEAAWTAKLAVKLAVPLVVDTAVTTVVNLTSSPVADQLERIPLPGPLKVRLMKTLLRDVHHYLYNVDFSPRPGAASRSRTRSAPALKAHGGGQQAARAPRRGQSQHGHGDRLRLPEASVGLRRPWTVSSPSAARWA